MPEVVTEDGMIRRAFGVSVKAVREESREVDVIASSEAIDSMDEIVTQDWDFATRFDGNPVVLYNHNRSSSFFGGLDPDDTLPIGFAKDYAVRQGKLHATLCFVDEKANPMAERCWQGFKQGSLRAVSVGFYSKDIAAEKRDGKDVYRLSGNVLCEISAVPLGANPEAVARRHEHLEHIKALFAEQEKRRAKAITNEGGAHAPAQEKTMLTPEQIAKLETDLKTANDALTTAQKSLETKTREVAESEERTKALAIAIAEAAKGLVEIPEGATGAQVIDLIASATKSAQKLAGERLDTITTHEVDALVGKKIAPAERDEMLAFAKESPERFKKLMAVRPDMKLTDKSAQTLGTEKTPPARETTTAPEATKNGQPSPTGGKELGALLQKNHKPSDDPSLFE